MKLKCPYLLHIWTIAYLLVGLSQPCETLPQSSTILQNPDIKGRTFRNSASEAVLLTSKLVRISPLALCTGSASFISGFDVGIIAGALLLLAPAFGIDDMPHR